MKTIDIQNAKVIYGTKTVLKNISWSVRKGERYFILGANGAGKTTLVKMLLGYLWPRYGARIQVLGEEYGRVNLAELRKRIAWVSPFVHQMTQNPNLTVCELVLSGRNSTLGCFHEITPEEEALAKSTLAKLNAEALLHERVQVLSSGEQVKVLIARALTTEPELMILDEPTVYLDVPGREFLLRTIGRLARENPELTLVFITQRIEDILPLFTHGMILKDGEILVDGPREETLTEENLKRAFGMELKLLRTESGRFWTVIE